MEFIGYVDMYNDGYFALPFFQDKDSNVVCLSKVADGKIESFVPVYNFNDVYLADIIRVDDKHKKIVKVGDDAVYVFRNSKEDFLIGDGYYITQNMRDEWLNHYEVKTHVDRFRIK